MRIGLMLFAVLVGALQPLQAVVNSQLAQRGATVIWAASISAAISSIALLAVALFVWRMPPPSLEILFSTPPILFMGGVLGALILVMMILVAPRLGVAMMSVCFVAGIVVCSLALDQFGAFGMPQQSLTVGRAAGAGLIVVAVILVRFF